MAFHLFNIGIFLFNLLLISVDIFSSNILFFKKILCFCLVLPVLLVGLPLARFLFKWIQKWYYFIVHPLPYFLSSAFEKWMAFQLGPGILALVGAGIFSLFLSFKINSYFIPREQHKPQTKASSTFTKIVSSQTSPIHIPSGFQLGLVNSSYSEVTLRSEPWDLASSPGKILKNSYLFVQDFGGPWIKVKDPYSELEGYLARQQLAITNRKEFPEIIDMDYRKAVLALSSQSLRIMESPSTQSSVVCEVRADEVIYVQDAETDWLHAKRPRTGEKGFVEKSLIRFVK